MKVVTGVEMQSKRGRSGYLLGTTFLCGVASLGFLVSGPAGAQTAKLQDEKQKQEQHKEQVLQLDTITISPTIQNAAAIDTMASTSVLTQRDIDRIQATTAADLFRAMPGVHASLRA